jgi:two-component system, NarL family, sensor kinase
VRLDGPARPPKAKQSKANIGLRDRLQEAEETLLAIRSGTVDALVIRGPKGPRVFTLKGAERAYRSLIESMNEGAVIVSKDGMVLYSNERFARMLKRPLAKVIGHPFHRFISEPDREALRPLLTRAARPAFTLQALLMAADDQLTPVQLSLRRLAMGGSDGAAFGMVVTDISEAKNRETILRGLSHSLLQAQEDDRRRLAVDLHDHASQSLGALLIRLRLLTETLPKRSKVLRTELAEISEMIGRTAEVVERISRSLRPSVLEILGLLPAMRVAVDDFAGRTGIIATLTCSRGLARLPPESELVLYRTLEEALRNMERHAEARHATVLLKQTPAVVELFVRDDGVGFDSQHPSVRSKNKNGMGLVGLNERVASVGGTLKINSTKGSGTEIAARIPLPPDAPHSLLNLKAPRRLSPRRPRR